MEFSQLLMEKPVIFMAIVIAVFIIIVLIVLIILLKPSDSDRTFKIFGAELSLKKRESSKPEKSESENATVVNNVNVNVTGSGDAATENEHTISVIKTTLSQLFESFSRQISNNHEQTMSSIDALRQSYINDAIQDITFHFSDFFDVNDRDFRMKNEMFNLIITYEFNNIMIERLKILEKSPEAEYDELNTMVEDAVKGIRHAIMNKLNTYVIFNQQESIAKFRELFDSSLNLLNRKISEFLRSYVKKTKEMKNAELEIIKERNKNIEIQIENILNLKREGGY